MMVALVFVAPEDTVESWEILPASLVAPFLGLKAYAARFGAAEPISGADAAWHNLTIFYAARRGIAASALRRAAWHAVFPL
ncbi:hypothetical protein BV898_17507 [Hypsibius exemplaris]|uniref:Uncharacterized protein n=1 Tax=Hypsibius exemplaris TaxID=2072580 RepID=A0A9X6NFN6_HYPEX|nr:hypothetical protein BV898_17507 [Hypsibius exemplaris]